MYEVEEYFTGAGECPFDEWLEGLQNIQAKRKILGRIARVRRGNLGLYRTLSEDGNPRLDTLHKILGAMGLRIGVTVQQPEACTQ